MLVTWILLALLIGLLALLAVPVRLSFSLQRKHNKAVFHVTLSWLFGLVRVRLKKPKTLATTQIHRHKVKGRFHHRKGKHRDRGAIIRGKGFDWRLLGLFRVLLSRVHIQTLNINVKLGLGDPADTGRLWAVIGPLGAIVTLPATSHVALEPDFTREVFEIDSKGNIHAIPLQLLLVTISFLVSPSTLRGFYNRSISVC